MKGTFLDRNKKKSVLAALLLFLRQRKILVVLLLLVLIASSVFVSPSSWITGLPGGARFEAGVAWIAGKMGIDMSRWGFGPSGRRSYADLLEAFREAKAGKNAAGWGPFFGQGANGGGGAVTPDSVGYVQGSKSDLEHGTGAGGAGTAGQTVAGIVDPGDAKNRGGDTVALKTEDVGGQREGFLANAFAGGFMHGFVGMGSDASGGPAASGTGPLSGGAYAGPGFFNGVGGAAGASNSLAKGGLAGLPAVGTPTSKAGGKAVGKLSAMASQAVEARAQKGVLGAQSLGGALAYTQLAEGNARDTLGTQYCQPPDCPAEYAATNSGAIYDGNDITAGFLTSSDPGANAAGLIDPTVTVPSSDGSSGGGGDPDAQQIQTCANMVQACQQSKTATMPQVGADETTLQPLYNAIPGACGDPCNCGSCNSLKSQIGSVCADLKTQLAAADQPCPPLPDYCAALGFTPAPFDSDALGAYCQSDFGQCGPKGLLAQLACLLGS